MIFLNVHLLSPLANHLPLVSKQLKGDYADTRRGWVSEEMYHTYPVHYTAYNKPFRGPRDKPALRVAQSSSLTGMYVPRCGAGISTRAPLSRPARTGCLPGEEAM